MRSLHRYSGYAVAALIGLGGCRVSSESHGDANEKRSEDVKFATPFGGMQVKTNEAVVAEGLGLPSYPGATPVNQDKNNGAADVNMNFGSFHLRVRAATFRTTDSPEKVIGFYKKALERYGDVIQCSDHKAVGTPVKTQEGLTCDDAQDHSSHFSADPDFTGKVELKAGSRQRQHIVAVDPESTGTKFGVVALELPGKLDAGNGEKGSSQ